MYPRILYNAWHFPWFFISRCNYHVYLCLFHVQVLTGEIENVTNATVTSLAVVPAIPPPPPEIPVIPPRYENATDEEGDPVIPPVDEIVTPPPIVSVTDDDDGQKTINFIIPSEMIVTREPYETVSIQKHYTMVTCGYICATGKLLITLISSQFYMSMHTDWTFGTCGSDYLR